MAAQIWAAAQVEREMGTSSLSQCLTTTIGSIAFAIVYFAGGIYGNILGGNFSRTGIPSVGASGALFATVRNILFVVAHIQNACVLVDLLLHWKYEDRPKLKVCRFPCSKLTIGVLPGYRVRDRYRYR